jgi:PAS domain S-box-containing protein
MLNRYFIFDTMPDPLLWTEHDPWLVALSLLVAMGGASVAMHLADLAGKARLGREREWTLASGALALGSSIWAMHYIGMLAFGVCGEANFDSWMTVLSILPGLAASWVALRLLARRAPSAGVLWGSGALMGAGIGAMHYIGMAASELVPLMRYDVWGFLWSLVVAVLLAVLALWVRSGLRRVLRWAAGWINLLAGCTMGLAIAAMHYSGMAALRFTQPLVELHHDNTVGYEHTTLSIAIATITIAMVLTAIAVNASLRYRQLLRQSQRNESRLRAISDTAVDGIITINGQGIVQSYNVAAERLLGWRAEEVVGRNVDMLMPEPHRSAHDGYLATHLSTGRSSIIGQGREVEARHKDGSLVPIRLAVGRVAMPGEVLFVGFLTDISARRSMELALRRSEKQLRTLVGNIPGVAFRCRIEGLWPMEFISEPVLTLTGWSADAFVQGQQHFGQIIDPHDSERIAPLVQAALHNDQPYHVEYRITTRDGQRRWVAEYGRGAADDHGVMRWIDGVLLDVTEAKERNAQFVSTVQALDRAEAVAEFTPQGRVLHANANFLRLFGYTLDELQGRSHALLCGHAAIENGSWQAFWQQLARGECASGEFQRFAKNGSEVWIHATYNPILDADGKVCKIIKFATDLSQRRAMEQDLRAAKERAEAAAAARASFLANMSHEIRTPMNAIIGFTEALLDTPLQASQRRQLTTVHHSSRSLLRLLNDILDQAKLDKGAVTLEVYDFSLRRLCQQVLDSLLISASKKNLPLRLDYPPEQPSDLRGDALRLQQVLVNLLGNAIKFTENGQVLLRVRYHEGWLCLQVQDSGIGMSAEQVRHVFDPFAQADASTTRRFGGTGLGTTIARQLVELMHGRIEVESQLGQGSTFSVHVPLPLGQASPAEAPAQAARPLQQLPAGLRILAVDDVPSNLELLQVHFARTACQFTAVGSGEEALRRCAHTPFDLVLMDLHMPGMDGLEAARSLRAQEHALQQPRSCIVALSASVLDEDRDNAFAAGMDGYAFKPIDWPRLAAEILRALQPGSTSAAPAPAAQPAQAAPLAAHDAANPPLPAIDWSHALALWGDAAPLHAALQRCLDDNTDIVAQWQGLHAQAQWPALAAGAHRLRGQAGNLGLLALQQCLGQLEQAARAGDAQACAQHLDALPDLWQALRAAQSQLPAPALAAHPAPRHEPAPTAQLPALATPQHSQVLLALEEALLALEEGALPEPALLTLATLLPAAVLQPIQEAVERFDFPLAQQRLQALRHQL